MVHLRISRDIGVDWHKQRYFGQAVHDRCARINCGTNERDTPRRSLGRLFGARRRCGALPQRLLVCFHEGVRHCDRRRH